MQVSFLTNTLSLKQVTKPKMCFCKNKFHIKVHSIKGNTLPSTSNFSWAINNAFTHNSKASIVIIQSIEKLYDIYTNVYKISSRNFLHGAQKSFKKSNSIIFQLSKLSQNSKKIMVKLSPLVLCNFSFKLHIASLKQRCTKLVKTYQQFWHTNMWNCEPNKRLKNAIWNSDGAWMTHEQFKLEH